MLTLDFSRQVVSIDYPISAQRRPKAGKCSCRGYEGLLAANRGLAPLLTSIQDESSRNKWKSDDDQLTAIRQITSIHKSTARRCIGRQLLHRLHLSAKRLIRLLIGVSKGNLRLSLCLRRILS